MKVVSHLDSLEQLESSFCGILLTRADTELFHFVHRFHGGDYIPLWATCHSDSTLLTEALGAHPWPLHRGVQAFTWCRRSTWSTFSSLWRGCLQDQEIPRSKSLVDFWSPPCEKCSPVPASDWGGADNANSPLWQHSTVSAFTTEHKHKSPVQPNDSHLCRNPPLMNSSILNLWWMHCTPGDKRSLEF